MGGTVGGLFISVALAWIAYRLARRSTLAGTVAFAMVMLLGCLSVFVQSVRRGDWVVKVVLDQLAVKRQVAQEDTEHLIAARIMRLDGLDSPGEIDRRLALIRRAVRSNADLLAAGDRIHDLLNARLTEADVSESKRERYLQQVDLRWSQVRGVHTRSARALAAYRDCFQFLREHEGQWHCDAKSRSILFNDEHLVEQFRPLDEEVKRSVAEISGS